DPAGLASANPANPQSWNRYAYALNNPLTLVDPLGLDPCNTISGGWQCYDPSNSSPGVGALQGPNLAGMTGSGSACGAVTAGCGHDAYQAYESWVNAVFWIQGNTVTTWGFSSTNIKTVALTWSADDGAYWAGSNGEDISDLAEEWGLPGLAWD